MTYYVTETANINAFCKAEELKAATLEDALKEAEAAQCFCGTVLYVGNAVNSQGFILPENRVAMKRGGEEWITYEEE